MYLYVSIHTYIFQVRKLVLKAMSSEDDAERQEKMFQTTPKDQLFKKVIDVIPG
jgi:hypothetical protein